VSLLISPSDRPVVYRTRPRGRFISASVFAFVAAVCRYCVSRAIGYPGATTVFLGYERLIPVHGGCACVSRGHALPEWTAATGKKTIPICMITASSPDLVDCAYTPLHLIVGHGVHPCAHTHWPASPERACDALPFAPFGIIDMLMNPYRDHDY
jgi:hypothetical protein